MRRSNLRLVTGTVTLAATLLGAAPPAAARSSLSRVDEGPPPGPAALYAPPGESPLLDNAGRWDAAPLLVSGAEAYRAGEYVYQDYLYDDYGANTTNAKYADPEPRPPSSELSFGGQTGDVVYPTAGRRYRYNAADLVELRVDASSRSIAYRFTLNTLVRDDSTAVAVGIDTDGGKKETDWGHGLGSLGPLDLEHVLLTDGTRAELDGEHVDVATDVQSNQIEVTVPRDLLDPGTRTWEHFAVTGIAGGKGGFAAVAEEPSKTAPGGSHGQDAPPVFNVAFRFEREGDEPIGGDETESGGRTTGYGHWREHGQAKALARRDISAFSAKIDFGRLARRATATNAPRHGYMNRIYVSSLDLGEGVAAERPWLLGDLQPYSVYVPKSYEHGRAAPLQLVLHSLSCTNNQFMAFSPNIYQHLGEDRAAIVLTTMGRGPDGWYHHEAELDVFEAWADVARNYSLDPNRVGINGYSMGGYGTFKLAAQYPDLFGKAFPVVGPAGEGIWLGAGDTVSPQSNTFNILDNLRHVPLLIWDGAADELVPVSGTTIHAQRLHDLGYRYEQNVFTADHFLLSVVDDWTRGAEFLGDARVDRNPAHVTYRVMPSADVKKYGLVHDHAYWLWDIEMRAQEGSPATGLVNAVSRASSHRDPPATPFAGGGTRPLPYVARGLLWGESERAKARNALDLHVENVADVSIGMRRAGIDVTRDLEVALRSDGKVTLRLFGDFPHETVVVDAKTGDRVAHRVADEELIISVDGGQRKLQIRVP